MYQKDRKEQVSEYVIPFIGADDGFYQYEIRIKTGALPFAGRNIFEYFFRTHFPRGFFIKRSSENMQQVYNRTPIGKCDLQLYGNHTSIRVVFL